MANVSRSLQRIKQDLAPFLPEASILGACRQANHKWRERKYGPVRTVHLFILQILSFNTAMTHLRHLAKSAVKAPAYCRARMRLPLRVLQQLLLTSSTAMQSAVSSGDTLWCGLKAYLVDGSSTIAPDTPDSQKAFGQPKACKPGCGFPVPKLLGLFDAFSGLIVQVLAFPLYTHEQSKVWKLHQMLGPGDLLVGDRGFCSFVHLTMLFCRGVFGLFRIHQKTTVNFRPHRKHSRKHRKGQARGVPTSQFVKRLAKHDQIVRWFEPSSKPKWMSQEQYDGLPDSLLVRELRFILPRRGQRTLVVTVATTLLDPLLYPKEKIVQLYGVRWRVETHLGQLKTTLKMRKVKSKTSQGVLKELTVYALVYNLVHTVMVHAARQQGVEPQRISFIDTLRWLLSAAPCEPLGELVVIPYRPDRHEPRVVKDQQDTYTKMCRPRDILRKELKQQSVMA